jgi:hypothetical protein
VNPLKEGYYGYKLFRAVAVASVAFAVLLADSVTGVKKIDPVLIA